MSDVVTKAPLDRVPCEKVQIGIRRRKKITNIASLAASIQDHGLIHPILLRGDNELVAGHRRLLACMKLGWKTIPARRVDTLSDEELRALELQENTGRLDLDDYEASKQRLAEIRQEQAAAEAAAAGGALSVADRRKKVADERKHVATGGKPTGRPKGSGTGKKPGSQRDVAERTGISPREQARIEQHVETADRFPFMRKEGWAKYRVLEAAPLVDALPEAEHGAVAVLLDQPGVPPESAIQILKNLGDMKPEQRERIYQDARDGDSHKRQQALAAAVQQPPMPDPGLLMLIDAARAIRRAKKECRIAGHAERFDALAEAVDALVAELRKAKEVQHVG